MSTNPTRRRALLTAAAGLTALAAPGLLRAETQALPAYPRHNSSGFQMQDWRDHFDSLGSGVIVADFGSRALHYWSGNGQDYRLFPTSVPLTEELTKRGYTEVVRKRVGPDWTPTADMRRRDPSLPAYLPPGKDNPLGTHAMYLSWPAYLIHGTHDTRKIGRPSSSGCVGLYNEHIEQLFAVVPVGTRVRII
ncbi:L,D-transpeptidase [Pseudomonas sp. GX19020]|uniref:L,D-transpeptidase n=1 Tax=Pseudomonadota TaxID=1224 RepID=UPI00089568D6|nr:MULTISPECIES: L,D-transpeptidase family protein [Pseudomonadota]MBJ2149286.1 L,D-transpeptidase family protein [Paracoccus sp. IB05]MCL4067074.1 L,D-transpeptidase [Pseudomonas sp. GX19020]SED12278.1 Lipoprotein-anchoring transpeptidase ErfK/SrfK [Rhodobacter sp. 24-YEA-8]